MKPVRACYYLNNKAFFCGPEPSGERSGEPGVAARAGAAAGVQSGDAAARAPGRASPPREPGTPSWCLRTHDALGPDGLEVSLRTCVPGRPCYRPEVEL